MWHMQYKTQGDAYAKTEHREGFKSTSILQSQWDKESHSSRKSLPLCLESAAATREHSLQSRSTWVTKLDIIVWERERNCRGL